VKVLFSLQNLYNVNLTQATDEISRSVKPTSFALSISDVNKPVEPILPCEAMKKMKKFETVA